MCTPETLITVWELNWVPLRITIYDRKSTPTPDNCLLRSKMDTNLVLILYITTVGL